MSLKPGYKQTEIEVIPDDWEAVRLGDLVSEPITDGPHLTPKFYNDGVPFLSVNNIVDGKILWNDLRYISPEDDRIFSVKCKPKRGDILFGKAASVGKIALVDADIDFNVWSPLAVIRCSASSSPQFVHFALQSSRASRQIVLLTNSSSQGNIGMTDIAQIEILLPPLKEQKVIAEALSAVDALIDSLEVLLTKKRNIKTGVMQELLTGRTRLPGFAGDWEIAKFGSICRRRRESGVPTAESFVIELEHIESGSGRLIGEPSVQTVSSKRMFQRGDVLFGRLRSYLRKYWLAEREGFCSTEIWALAPENERVESGFLFQIVRLDEFITATGISYGTHMPRSDWSTIKEWPLTLPPLEEQKAIAKVLSDIDDEIEALEKRLAKTRDLKQGMAQELLTGRTRLV